GDARVDEGVARGRRGRAAGAGDQGCAHQRLCQPRRRWVRSAGLAQALRQGGPGARAAGAGMSAPRKRVLVVEDDLEVAAVIVRTLRAFEFDVEHVTRGAELLERVRAAPPAACIVDLGLPDG